jgi:hypothetical protein
MTDRDAGDSVQLTYEHLATPWPLTQSVEHEDPLIASLQVVITNQTESSVEVDGIDLIVQVGQGAALTPSTSGIETYGSDPSDWAFIGPSGPPVTYGSATYTLTPVEQYGTFESGDSLVVVLGNFATVPRAVTTTVWIRESVHGGTPGFTSFSVTTFAPGGQQPEGGTP